MEPPTAPNIQKLAKLVFDERQRFLPQTEIVLAADLPPAEPPTEPPGGVLCGWNGIPRTVGGLTVRENLPIIPYSHPREDPPQQPRGVPRVSTIVVPDLEVRVSELQLVKQRLQSSAEKLFPDPPTSYSTRTSEEAAILTRAVQTLAILHGLLAGEGGMITPTLVAEEIREVQQDLCQTLIQLKVFEKEGWRVTKWVTTSQESFMDSKMVQDQMKVARKTAAIVKEPKKKKDTPPRYVWAQPSNTGFNSYPATLLQNQWKPQQ